MLPPERAMPAGDDVGLLLVCLVLVRLNDQNIKYGKCSGAVVGIGMVISGIEAPSAAGSKRMNGIVGGSVRIFLA